MAEKKLTAKIGLDDSEFKRKLAESSNSVNQFGAKIGGLGAAIGVGGIATAFTLIKKGIESSGEASDILNAKVAGISGAFTALAQNVINLDFSRSLKDAYDAASDLEDKMDQINDQILSESILHTQNAVKIAQLRNDLKDVSLSTSERLSKEKQIQSIIEEELAIRKNITDQQLAAVNASNAKKYGITTEDANLYLEYLSIYAKLGNEERDRLDLAMNLNKVILEQKRNSGGVSDLDLKRSQYWQDVKNAAASLPPELAKYLSISKIIFDYTPKEKNELGKIISGYNQANASLLRQLGMVDWIGDRLDNQADSTGQINENIRKAADAYAVWQSQIRVNYNEPVLPGGNPLQSGQTVGISTKDNVVTSIAEQAPSAVESINQLGSSFDRLGNSIGGVAGEWISYVGNLVSTIPTVVAALAAMAGAERKKASASALAAGAGAASAEASIPIVGPILAIAAIAAVMGAILAMPKLANGGIAFGPTTAMVGEYPGARSNPEVIAPLNKLRGIMESGGGTLTGRLRGQDLMIATEKAKISHNINT